MGPDIARPLWHQRGACTAWLRPKVSSRADTTRPQIIPEMDKVRLPALQASR